MKKFKIKINKNYNFSNQSIIIGDGKEITIDYINKIRHSLNMPLIKNKYKYYEKLMFSLTGNDMFFDDLLSKKNKIDYMNYLKQNLQETSCYIGNYFLDIFVKRLQLFDRIINLKNCEKTIYDHNTVTGRLKVIGGTNFLTMKKDSRKNLKHKNESRRIFEIDFKSCEPNFYLKSQNINYESQDVYDFLSKKFNIAGERDNLKRGILAIMYGAGIETVSKISKIKISQLKAIKDYMKIEEFKSKLNKELQENGFIKNFYGRPLLSKNNLLNHWVQSSTADYCILAFKELIDNKPLEIHGIIHDAAIVSANNKDIMALTEIKETISNIKIPVDINLLR